MPSAATRSSEPLATPRVDASLPDATPRHAAQPPCGSSTARPPPRGHRHGDTSGRRVGLRFPGQRRPRLHVYVTADGHLVEAIPRVVGRPRVPSPGAQTLVESIGSLSKPPVTPSPSASTTVVTRPPRRRLARQGAANVRISGGAPRPRGRSPDGSHRTTPSAGLVVGPLVRVPIGYVEAAAGDGGAGSGDALTSKRRARRPRARRGQNEARLTARAGGFDAPRGRRADRCGSPRPMRRLLLGLWIYVFPLVALWAILLAVNASGPDVPLARASVPREPFRADRCTWVFTTAGFAATGLRAPRGASWRPLAFRSPSAGSRRRSGSCKGPLVGYGAANLCSCASRGWADVRVCRRVAPAPALRALRTNGGAVTSALPSPCTPAKGRLHVCRAPARRQPTATPTR